MAIYNSAPLTDPDDLTFLKVSTSIAAEFAGATDELLIDYTNRRLALKVKGVAAGDLTNDGVTIKCVYSRLKEAWRTDADLVKFPFPMGPITDEQFEMINGWNWDKVQTSGTSGAALTTVELLRTGGWSVVKNDAPNAGAITEMWAGIITLGSFAANTDNAYFQQVAGGAATNIKLTNNVNQAVQIYSDPNGDGSFGDGYDYRTYFKIFLREYAKTYAQSANTEIGASAMTYQAYRFPLSNVTDLKVTHTDAAVGGVATVSGSWSGGSATVNTSAAHGLTTGNSVTISGVTPAGYNGTFTVTVSDSDTITYVVADPGGVITVQGTVTKDVYTDVNVTYLRDANDALYTLFTPGTVGSYVVGNVISDNQAIPRWFKCTTAGTVDATDLNNLGLMAGAGTAVFAAYEGERKIGTNYYAFKVIIDADLDVATTVSGTALRAEVYEKVQYLLRQNSDIDSNAGGTVTGKIADTLLRFVGDTLITSQGVYIDSFNSNDTNDIEFYDASNVKVLFPYVATITINFGDNLKNDGTAKYWLFFSSGFGTASAIIVDNANETPLDIAGTVSGASNVTWTFDYDNNIQGGRTAGQDAAVTAVGLGLATGQYVSATGVIAKSKANAVSLVAALERNYSSG